ncbi:MAG: hypothetical protein KAI79_11295 [Bacteroidales bacterium]|nr:hypothetical protein [Bacteroidales bacterium]
MSAELEVLHQAGYEISLENFEKLKEKHTYIGEKLILDLVNGIQVVARDHNNIAKGKEKGFGRLWDGLSGNAKKRQNLINENVIVGLHSASKWLSDHDKHLGRVDQRIKDVANELYSTQDEILKFYGQFKEIDLRVDLLEEFKKSVNDRFDNVEYRLTKVEAHQHVDREIEKIGTLGFPVPIEVFTILDNLVSGEAGLYHFQETNVEKKTEFLRYMQNKIKNKINTEELKQFIDYQQLSLDLNQLEAIEKKAISFISSQYSMFSNDSAIYEIVDLLSVMANTSQENMEDEILEHSNIRTFMTLGTFVDDATKELLTI